jgi:hypothetical protein
MRSTCTGRWVGTEVIGRTSSSVITVGTYAATWASENMSQGFIVRLSLFWKAVIGSALIAVGIFGWLKRDAVLFAHDHSLMAYIQCNDFVAARFKVADTEELPLYAYEADATKNETYSIRSHIDTLEGAAPGLRINYFCKIRWNGHEEILQSSWQLLELRIVDRTMRTEAPAIKRKGV